ncbi:MAG: tetratricopeptide repeat protein [Desulfobulbus sp.]|jgi:tetratricopeptide (TPR) repeat protein|uniref:tetratricopeptide repeat protein n=1 Tax=Desulfobulbus sp. TaxID=895 RepID=UPI00283E6138|nr:tetratricopeptide repeat protein [Desulfobulbus sp.]MDR2548735.1 tetratricopeptide repeat protein [Desulfobulbus sp.]
MNGSILGALLVVALLAAYLVWKMRTAGKRSAVRTDPEPVPTAAPQELTGAPATTPESPPVRDDAEAATPLTETEMPSVDAGSEGKPAPLADELAGLSKSESDEDEPAPVAAPVFSDRDKTQPTAESPENLAAQPLAAAIAPEEPIAAAPQAGLGAPTILLSLDAYASRMNDLEERQRTLLGQAIADRDEGLRDRLQRELVVMNDRLALIADSHAEEVACLQRVLDTLMQLRRESETPPALEGAVAGLCGGNAGSAEACLAEWGGQPPAMAGKVAFCRGQLAECRVDLQQALTQYRQAVALEPDDSCCLQAAGRVARTLYNYKEAIPWLESLVHLARKSSADDPLALALAQRELAYTYVLAGQHQKAGPLYKESMTALARKLGQDHHELATCWFQIGELQETLGEYDKAVSLYRKALAIVEKQKGAEHPALAAILDKLAALCTELEMETEAVSLYERLVRIQEKTLRPSHLQLAISLNSLGESYRLVGRYGEAESCYQKILTIHEATYGPDHPSVAAVLQELAKLHGNLRRPEEARQYQERAAAIFQKSVEAQQKKGGEESLTLEL